MAKDPDRNRRQESPPAAGPGVEAEEGEAVEVGLDGAKLLTLGVGKVDKDAVLQAAKAQIDSIKAAREEIVFEILDIRWWLGPRPRRGAAVWGLVKEVVNEMDELAGGLGDFGDHGKKVKGGLHLGMGLRGLMGRIGRPEVLPWALSLFLFPLSFFPDETARAAARRCAWGRVRGDEASWNFQWRESPRDGRRFSSIDQPVIF